MLGAVLVFWTHKSWHFSPRNEHSDMDEEQDGLAKIREAVEYIAILGSHWRLQMLLWSEFKMK